MVEGCPAHPPPPSAGQRRAGAGRAVPLCSRASEAPTRSTWVSSCSGACWCCCSAVCPAGRSSSTPSSSCCYAGRTRPCPGAPGWVGPCHPARPTPARAALSGSPAVPRGLGLGTLPYSMLLQLWPAGSRPQPILIEKRHLYGICLHLVPAWARALQRLRKQ